MSAAATTRSSPVFGSFTLLAKLARGDIGDLFLARSQGAGGFEKLVIIKRIHADLMRDPRIAELFLEEARVAARVEHPNVRIIYEIGKNEHNYYIALEYLEGVPLVDVLLERRRDKSLGDTRLLIALLSQACQGLHAAHILSGTEDGLVHGDVNPRSIFITASGTAKILDFDIVQMRGTLADRHGFVRRTCAYMSPEEVRTGKADKRGDIFSLGVVAWEALTGRRLFKQSTREQTLAAIDRGRIPNIHDFRPSVSDELNNAVMRALNRDPSLRFHTAQDFGAALTRSALVEGPPLTPVNIASLLALAFNQTLTEQRDFVRAAREGLAAPLTASHLLPLEDETAVVPPGGGDPDDWANELSTSASSSYADHDTTATQSSPDALGAGVGDPFFEAASNADYSQITQAPLWSDTRNLVLSEIVHQQAPVEEEDTEQGAVEFDATESMSSDEMLDSFDTEHAEPPTVTGAKNSKLALALAPSKRREGRRAAPKAIPPVSHRPVPTPVPQAPVEAVPYRRPEPDLPLPAAHPSASRSTSKRTMALSLVAVLIAVVSVSAIMMSGDSDKNSSETVAAEAKTAPSVEPSADNASKGQSAAASIVAAAEKPGEEETEDVEEAASEQVESAGDELEDDAAEMATDEVDNALDDDAEETDDDAEETEDTADDEEDDDDSRDANSKRDRNSKRQRKDTNRKRNKNNRSNKSNANKTERVAQVRSGTGFLTVNASPYATVFVDGKKRGITPLVKLKLSSGSHILRLVNSDDGKAKNLRINISPNDELRRNVRF